MLWQVWNPSLSLCRYHLLQRDWFCWAIIIYHGEGYGWHNSSVDNNLHTTAICPDVVRTTGALQQRVVCHAFCHQLGFFICKGKAAADMDGDFRTWSAIPRAFVEILSSREKWSLAASSGVRSICGIRHCNYITSALVVFLTPFWRVMRVLSGMKWAHHHCWEVKGYTPRVHIYKQEFHQDLLKSL